MGKIKKEVKTKAKTKDKPKVTKKAVKPVKKTAAKKPAKPVKTAKPAKKEPEKKPHKAYSKEILAHFKKVILKQRTEMVEEIESLNDRMVDSTTREFTDTNSVYSLHMADQGTDAMEREKSFLLAQRSDDYVRRLDEALKRIDEGTFGVCVVCGDLIEKERLEAVPTTQKHVDCKNKLKKINNENQEF
jgi:DnaK suppressor protein